MNAGEKIINGLAEAVAHAKAERGGHEEWIKRSNAVSRFIAGLHDSTRIFARGEVRVEKGHFPAVLTFNSGTRQTWAWAPSGRKGSIEAHHEMFFWSNQDWKGSCREVFAQGTSGSAQDAQRLDPKGAGPVAEGHAPETPIKDQNHDQ